MHRTKQELQVPYQIPVTTGILFQHIMDGTKQDFCTTYQIPATTGILFQKAMFHQMQKSNPYVACPQPNHTESSEKKDQILRKVTVMDRVYQIEHVIGPRYGLGSVPVELLDYGCNTIINSTGLEVSVEGEPYIPGENFSYNITLDSSSLIGQNIGEFVSFSEINSLGSIAFCRRHNKQTNLVISRPPKIQIQIQII